MSLKVDFLLKSELIYEARVRGLDVSSDILVNDLRKKVRELVKLGVNPNPSNLVGKIRGSDEFECIKGSLETLKNKIEELTEEKVVSDVIRAEVKLAHYESRLSNFVILFTSRESGSSKVTKLQETVASLKELLAAVNVDIVEKELIVGEITRHGEIEDEFEQSLTGKVIKPVPVYDTEPVVFGHGITARDNSLCYAKLPNPLERHLKNFKPTDGLNAHLLLEFIKNMLAIKKETKLRDSEILEVALGYCSGPLYNKILKCKDDRSTISETHLIILKQFIPMDLRENMKRDMVNRPQRSNEALEVYINEIKVYSEVLNTRYTEEELVEVIKLGVNPYTRSKLVFMGNPQSFDDLDQMCIHVQNVEFKDGQRREVRTNTPQKPVVRQPVNNVVEHKTCYICKRSNHVAKDCYYNQDRNKPTSMTPTQYTPQNKVAINQYKPQSFTPRRQPEYNSRPMYNKPSYNKPFTNTSQQYKSSSPVNHKQTQIDVNKEETATHNVNNNNVNINKGHVNNISVLPTIQVNINNKLNQEALIDTGSSINVISMDLFNKIKIKNPNIQLKDSNVVCSSANTNKMELLGQCALKIKINNFTWKVTFLVSKKLTYALILGSSFIKKSGMVVDLNKNHCYFNFKPNIKTEFIHSLTNVKVSINNVTKEVNIGCSEVKEEILSLIKQYPQVYTAKIGCGIDFEYDIQLTDTKPVNVRPYPLSPPKMQDMRNILDDLLKQGIIKPSKSSYNSPAFLVPKGNNQYRLVVNYSEVNKKIERVNTPLGELHEMYHYLEGAKYFTVLDLCSSFHQIKLSEKCQHITSFSTNYESYMFTRVPMGLHLGSSLLSSYLNKVLDGLKFKCALNYVDDLIIYSKTLEEHLDHVRQVTERLAKWNLTVNPEKVKFVYKNIKFLGYVISHNEVKIDPDRTSSLLSAKPPVNVKGVSRFIGMASYFAKFIPNYAEIAAPLNELRKKNVPFVWDNRCQNSFDRIKSIISSPPTLKIPSYNQEFVLHTDSSNNAIGSCLLQSEGGDLKPVAFYSRKLNQKEQIMSIYHKECLAVTASILKFYSYLEVKPFILRCDNSALAWILTHCRKLGKLARWCETILSLPFKVEIISGKDNVIADYLSRMFESNGEDVPSEEMLEECYDKAVVQEVDKEASCSIDKPSVVKCSDNNTELSSQQEINSNITDYPMTFTQLKVYQQKDTDILQIIDSINKSTNSDKFYIKNGLVMYKHSARSKERIYLPEELVNMTFDYFHTSVYGGHPGISNTFRRINQYFYRPNLWEQINKMVKECELCIKCKSPNKYYKGSLISSYAKEPFEKLYIDIFGPLTRSTKQHKYVLIVLDCFSRFVWLFPMREVKTSKIIELLNDRIFSMFSLPKTIISDNASYFVSHEIKQFYFKKGIIHKTTIPYQPQGNKSERYLKNLKAMLKIYAHEKQCKWDSNLSELNLAINSNISESTGYTAFQLMFTHTKNDPLTNKWNLNELVEHTHSEEDRLREFNKAIENVRRGIQRNRRRWENTQNSTTEHERFAVGKEVYIRIRVQSNLAEKFQEKLHPIYDGPFKVLAKMSDVSLLVQSIKQPKDVRRVHIKDVKVC